eukprot:1176683-Prorocentrum_minimum.AAC.4
MGQCSSTSPETVSSIAPEMTASETLEEHGPSIAVYLAEPVDLRATVFGAGRMGCAMAGCVFL